MNIRNVSFCSCPYGEVTLATIYTMEMIASNLSIITTSGTGCTRHKERYPPDKSLCIGYILKKSYGVDNFIYPSYNQFSSPQKVYN